MEILLLQKSISDFLLNGYIDLPFSENPRMTWVEHISPSLGTYRRSTCSFQPFNTPNVVLSEATQLLEIKHVDQCQSAQHWVGSNLRYTSQHTLEPTLATGF